MNNIQIENTIHEFIVANSRFEPKRDYLSISHVTGCPRRAAWEYRYGFRIQRDTHRMCFAGYEHEKSILEILIRAGIITQVGIEVVAPFDDRLRGHVDGVSGNHVIEIKSVSVKKWEKLLQSNRAFREHFIQCQLYMLYGGFRQAFIIYRNRDTYEHKVIGFPFDERVAREAEGKAKVILDAIDGGERPACECGKCS